MICKTYSTKVMQESYFFLLLDDISLGKEYFRSVAIYMATSRMLLCQMKFYIILKLKQSIMKHSVEKK